ncbi:MAG: hypothetical protein GY853_13425 [PVC group bacterium]|nr:hypothetical protein [PVC group bacterium]
MSKITPTVDLDKSALRASYIQAVSDLGTAPTANLNTISKLETAFKLHAAITLKLLKGIKRLIT